MLRVSRGAGTAAKTVRRALASSSHILLPPSYEAPLRSKRACHLRLLCVSVFQSSAKTSEPLPFISILSQPVSEPSAGIAPAPTSKQATQGVDIKTVLPLLPASYRTKDSILQVPNTGPEFLWYELGVDRLNIVHPWLWMTGPKDGPRWRQALSALPAATGQHPTISSQPQPQPQPKISTCSSDA